MNFNSLPIRESEAQFSYLQISMHISRQASYILLGLGLVLGITACFLPWSGNEIATLSGFNGTLGNPGVWVLVLIGLRAGLHFLNFPLAKRVAMLMSVLLLTLALNHLKTAFRLEMASPQIGLYLLLLAAGILGMLGFLKTR